MTSHEELALLIVCVFLFGAFVRLAVSYADWYWRSHHPNGDYDHDRGDYYDYR